MQAVLSVFPNASAMHPHPTPIDTSCAVQAGAPALLFVAVENTVEVAVIVIVFTIGAAATDTVDVVALPDCVLKMDLFVCNCFRDVAVAREREDAEVELVLGVDEAVVDERVVLAQAGTEPISGVKGCTSITEKSIKDVLSKKFCLRWRSVCPWRKGKQMRRLTTGKQRPRNRRTASRSLHDRMC